MKRIIFITVGIFVLIALAALGYALIAKPTADTVPASPVTFPLATSSGSSSGGSIGSVSGDSITVKDFINNGVTIEDPANEGHYYLAGDPGVCTEEGDCPTAGEERRFTIVYFSGEKSFAISLNEEPLGEVRQTAEAYLMDTLGISQDQMCSLNYYVGTTVYVNSIYGSRGNLGFSFCPGATQLP